MLVEIFVDGEWVATFPGKEGLLSVQVGDYLTIEDKRLMAKYSPPEIILTQILSKEIRLVDPARIILLCEKKRS